MIPLPTPLWMRSRLAGTARPRWHRIVTTAPSDVLAADVVAVAACGVTSGPLGATRTGGGRMVAGHWELAFADRDPINVHVCLTCALAVRAGRAA